MEDQKKIYGYTLTHALENFELFKSLPLPEQNVLRQLSNKFEAHYGSHFMSPEELSEELGSTAATWRRFLTLKPVRDYVTKRTEEDVEIYNRQAIAKQAIRAAEAGDNKAATYLAKLAETTQNEGNKTKVILHYIPRPDRT